MGAVDTDDLEALFDQVAAESAAQRSAAPAPAASAASAAPAADPSAHGNAPDVFHRVGALTRDLHDALRELGYDKVVAQAMASLPDARDRLDYIARLTGQAAERALGAVEKGTQLQDALRGDAARLAERWDAAFAGTLTADDFRATAEATREFLAAAQARASDTNAQLHEIMMAQDFHDLTGQVIQRIVAVAQRLEAQLVQLLIEVTPPAMRPAEEGFLSGPAVSAAGRSDVVQNQAQVDDLLESLGF